MKRFTLYLTLFALAVLAFLPVTAHAAQVDQYPAELEYYDAQIDVMLPRLEAFQAQYYGVNGRYYQALESHTTAPDVPTVPDGIYDSPTDQPEDLALFWDSFAALPDVLAWSFRIGAYNGPDGDGFVLTVTTVVDGVTWQRTINQGPDTWRDADWHIYTPAEF